MKRRGVFLLNKQVGVEGERFASETFVNVVGEGLSFLNDIGGAEVALLVLADGPEVGLAELLLAEEVGIQDCF